MSILPFTRGRRGAFTKSRSAFAGRADRKFLERVFHKLLLNFTWWVNRKDPDGMNVFEGGFLGLDNIGVFDRSAPLPTGGHLEQSDGTSWMGMYCLNMLAIALELAREDSAYGDVASKFFEHFVHIAQAMNDHGTQGIGLWDEEDGFYYDASALARRLAESVEGALPGGACSALCRGDDRAGDAPESRRFLAAHEVVSRQRPVGGGVSWIRRRLRPAGTRRLLALANKDRLLSVLRYMLHESEFLSPHGIRSLSRYHREHPFIFRFNGMEYRVDYEPAESVSGTFGGNSNWRGPIWFPGNFLLIESLQKFHYFYGDSFTVECPTGSGNQMTLWEVAAMLSRRLTHIFLRSDSGSRPVFGDNQKFQSDPHWRDLVLFYEYFHGETGYGLGASHQTGWTGLMAKLLEQSGQRGE